MHFPPLPPLEDTVVGKRFATWLYTVRKARGVGQEALSEQLQISKSWISRLETGGALPQPALAQRIAQALEDDPFRACEALAADKEHALEKHGKKIRPKGAPQTREERIARGRDVRLWMLRCLARRMITHGAHPTLAAIGRDLSLSDKAVRKHLGQLEEGGYVRRASLETEVACYALTLDGLERALDKEWKLPVEAEADPVWLFLAKAVLTKDARLPPPWERDQDDPPPPPSALPAGPRLTAFPSPPLLMDNHPLPLAPMPPPLSPEARAALDAAAARAGALVDREPDDDHDEETAPELDEDEEAAGWDFVFDRRADDTPPADAP